MKTLKNWSLIAAIVLFAGSFQAKAADSSSGCGVGWMIFKDQSLISSALRATTNGIFLNTIAMTFGTSGCARHSIVLNDKKTLHYTEANQAQLQMEVAQGSGEHLNGLSYLMDCSPEVFSSTLQENYGEVFNKERMSAREVVNNIQAQVLLNKNLARSCGII